MEDILRASGLCIIEAKVAQLRLQIPWTSLGAQPMLLILDGVECIIAEQQQGVQEQYNTDVDVDVAASTGTGDNQQLQTEMATAAAKTITNGDQQQQQQRTATSDVTETAVGSTDNTTPSYVTSLLQSLVLNMSIKVRTTHYSGLPFFLYIVPDCHS